jgi:hypothetical protein
LVKTREGGFKCLLKVRALRQAEHLNAAFRNLIGRDFPEDIPRVRATVFG